MIVESEFDAMLLWQELGSLFKAYIALGSASTKPNFVDIKQCIESTNTVFFCPDQDKAGIKALESWKYVYPNIIPVELPCGKDPTEAYQNGVNLKKWGLSLLGIGKPIIMLDKAFKEISLNSYEDYIGYISTSDKVLALHYNQITDIISFFDGKIVASGLYSELKIDWQGDFKDIMLITHNPSLLHRDIDCSVKLESSLYLYHVMCSTYGDISLQKLTQLIFGKVAHPVIAIYHIFEKFKDGLSSLHYKILRDSQFAVGEMMKNGIPFDIENGSELKYANFCDENSRIHTYLAINNTITGRFTSSAPNLHSYPNEEKNLIKSREGYVLIDGDYKACELRVAAELSENEHMLNLMQAGEDLHKNIMEEILGREVSEKERDVGKLINFGILYGQSMRNLDIILKNNGITIDKSDLDVIINDFYLDFFEWRREQCENVSEKFGVYTAINRFIPLYPTSDRWANKVVNYIVQGSAADMLLYALSILPRFLENTSAKILLCIHDEILLEAKEQDCDIVKTKLKEAMTEAYKTVLNSDNLNNLVDIRSGCTWSSVKM